MSQDSDGAIPISPPFWCSWTKKYAVRIDHGSQEYLLRWTDSGRQPDLSHFPPLEPVSSLEIVPHSEEEDKIWASSVPQAFGSYAHVRRSKASNTQYPMYKISHRTRTSISMIRNEFQILEEIHSSDLPIVKVGATPLADASGIFGFTMEELSPIKAEDIPLYYTDMERALDRVHRGGYVHTDISISNFMLADTGQVQLIDFGQAGKLGEALPEYHPHRRRGFKFFERAMDTEGMEKLKERTVFSEM